MAKYLLSFGMAVLFVTVIGVGTVPAQLPDTIDFNLDQENMRILGDDGRDYSGSVASGDVNGDGYDDLIIGAYSADPAGRTDAGETYVIYGSATGTGTIDLANGEEDVRILGDDANDWSGRTVASGDVNGDGYDDIVIGAIGGDGPSVGNTGETYVVYGSDSLPDTIDLANGEENIRILGDDMNDYMGSFQTTGDVNGDGYEDLIIGALYADPDGRTDGGETYVIYGGDTLPATIDLANGEEDVRVLGDDFGDQLGGFLASGDVNGDGYSDLVLAANWADPNGIINAGEVYVIYGSQLLPEVFDLDAGDEDVRILGDDMGDLCGCFVSSGDITGDGYDDILIGAWSADQPERNRVGEAYLIYGSQSLPATIDFALNEEDVRILGDDAEDWAGFSVEASGDLNHDGYKDIVIGVPGASPSSGIQAGETCVVYGSAALPTTIDLSSGEEDIRILGDDGGDFLGYERSLACGDLNGDGYDDLIIGAYRADQSGGYDAGETYVIFGIPVVTDNDGDGILDDVDNCPITFNPDQTDYDEDGLGDACDPDDDNDGIEDMEDNCPITFNPDQADYDEDGLGDACDPDDDNDGIVDSEDACPFEDATAQDANGDGCIDSVEDMPTVIEELALPQGTESALISKVDNAVASLESGNEGSAVNQLEAFINYVEAQSGKKISEEDAAMLIDFGTNVISQIEAGMSPKSSVSVPGIFSLSQNYPNPFNPETEIAFDLPENARVTVTVYNVLGQVVEILVDAELSPGRHVVRWNGSQVSSGVYFYRMVADGFTDTKRMVLRK
ncbi:MAG: FG-GAP repeat protein [Gemmatimonadota bacterium]|nr:MAG: FG-GAP repeat protein [Gemmatimonadota bacterium]